LHDPTLQEPVESTPDARWLNRFGHYLARPWLGVLSRTLAAIVGGYALAATCSMFFAVALPVARAQAVLTGMLVAIVLCACAALWAFATRTALRAWLGIALPTVLFWLGTIVLGARA
jgi:chromate transport protein ChrA